MTATSPAASPTTSLTARPVFPAAALTQAAMLAAPYWDAFAALEAAVDDARIVTGDDGLDHYLSPSQPLQGASPLPTR